jgi:hypothetical protein
MKQQIEKKLVMVLIAGCLLFLFLGNSTTKSPDTGGEAEEAVVEPVYLTASRAQEKVIYTCRLGDEEIPAVQISEVTDSSGQVTATIARVSVDTEIEITARGAAPVWDYKSISARSEESLIEVAFRPDGKRQGFDWILTLADKNTYFSERVRDCMEVSDE